MSPPPPPRSLKARALQWLAQREQSRVELRRKLLAYAVADAAAAIEAGAAPPDQTPAECVDGLLDWLEAHRYLSPERFAESRVHTRSQRFGNLRIRQELKQHRVALSPEAARALESSEQARAGAVRARKFPHPPESAAERARQARFLAGRGFSPDVVARALREAGCAAPCDDDSFDDLAPAAPLTRPARR